ncbi:MAG: hypothetical protein KF859_04650 [Phycisphaeraceae bacterium]|nr:hypothetical protein [Phycisphaeraceae bacterium]
MYTLRAAAATAWLTFSSLCAAQAHPGDILLTLSDNKIVTGIIDSQGSPLPGERVFLARFGFVAPNFTPDPGFDCLPGTFPVGTRNGFRLLKALRVWNGSDFSQVAQPRIEVAFATLSALTPEIDSPVDGFLLNVGSNGQWHRHYDYTLLDPAGDGVYLLEMSIFSNAPSIQESDPFWIVFNQNAPNETVGQAAQWVRDNLLAGEPCVADFNQDGGVDGADVEAFFLSWEAGDTPADVNQDGGVDGADVEYFFVQWEAGGC